MVLVIVVSHWYEDLNWLKNSPWKVILCDKNGSAESPFTPDEKCTLGINKGREASSYLKYIIEYYDNLPDHIAFLHGHEDSWHQKYPGHLFDAIRNARISEYDYISLNNSIDIKTRFNFCDFYTMDPELKGHVDAQPETFQLFERYWDIFQPILKTEVCPHYFRFNCGAQFIVSRTAIKKHSKSSYKTLLKYLLNENNDYMPAVTLEYIWGVLFGEDHTTFMSDLHYRKTRFVESIIKE